MFTMVEIIDLAIRVEKNGQKTYRKAAREVSNPRLASMLEWLAEDEAEHEKWFDNLKHGMVADMEDPKLEEMGRAILQNVLGDQAFSLDDADLTKMDDVRGLLEISLEFEKDTIVFYEMLMEFIDESKVSAGIKKIIDEEKRHVKRLEDFIEKKEILPVGGS